ncbi:MAG TPA: tyrosine/phenylalanine carboxypeptidase domain-containing protein [Polyangiaceae bacterium]
MRAVRLIGAASPVNADAETERLAAELGAGRPCVPAWAYRAHDLGGASETLASLARAFRGEPFAQLYSARIEELRLEAAMVEAVGTARFGELAALRFRQTPRAVRAADAMATAWAPLPSRDDDERVPTDSGDPRSLLSRVRAAIGRHRAPFSVRVAPSLGTLAATGERTVYVAAGRSLGERAARRIALHEVEGHVMPRVRARSAHPIFALGTARGTDDQEGLALFYEERAGMLDAARRVELARRHLAARAMQAGADFVEVARGLVDLGADAREAVVIASRAFRGSDGRSPGLGRECVYITCFLRVRDLVREDPGAERVLASGQVALDAIAQLVAGRHASPEPPATSPTL